MLAVSITGIQREALCYHLSSEFSELGVLGSVESDGKTSLYLSGEELPDEISILAEQYACSISIIEHLEADFDYVQQSTSKWYPISFSHFAVLPILTEDFNTHSAFNQIAIRPGGGFGTGHHPTTWMMLSKLNEFASEGRKLSSFWDIGSGSALLAIVLSKIFKAKGLAWEIDKLAVANARENLQLNDISLDDIKLFDQAFEADSSSPELIVANLYSSLHHEFEASYRNALSSGGVLMISGILAEEYADIRALFRTSYWRTSSVRRKGDWLMFVIEKR